MRRIELEVSSNITGILNFLLFDLVLITLVYSLSSDIIGRLNDKTLRTGGRHVLHICTPTFLGAGLCSTTPSKMLYMRTLRIIGMLTILLSNGSMEGFERRKTTTATLNVRTMGSIVHLKPIEVYEEAISASGCMHGAKRFEMVYFGQLRVVDNATQCVSDPKLLPNTTNLLAFGIQAFSMNVSTGQCVPPRRRILRAHSRAEYVCERAVLSCEQYSNDSCRGILSRGNQTFLLERSEGWPDMQRNATLTRIVRGIDWKDPMWLDAMLAADYEVDMQDIVLASSVSGRREMDVKVYKIVAVTRVSFLWIVAVSTCTGIVLMLAMWVAYLRWKGYKCVLHDEIALRGLLVTECEYQADFLNEKAIHAYYNDILH